MQSKLLFVGDGESNLYALDETGVKKVAFNLAAGKIRSLTVAANKYYKPEYADRFPNIHEQRAEAVEHFLKCAEALEQIGCGYIENPIGIMSRLYKKPTQIIQPCQFGHTERKSTCLWLNGLPKLQPTEIVEPDIIIHKSGRTDSRLHYETFKLPKEERRKARSKTFSGIAQAMSEQWFFTLAGNGLGLAEVVE